jgi:uncharacterized membrane protein YdbT with pleckstrin-like domain
MGYIEQTLGLHETVIGRARFHWIYKLQAWLALIFLGIFVVGIFIFFNMMIYMWTTEIAVTNTRFIVKTGFFSLKTNEITLPNIETVSVTQSVWGRIFGFGHLRVEGTGVGAVELPTIADPVGFRRAIETAKEGMTAKA